MKAPKHDWRVNPYDCPGCKAEGHFKNHSKTKPPFLRKVGKKKL